MFVFLAGFFGRIKAEIAFASLAALVVAGIGLLANAVTSPKVLMAMQVVGEWESIWTRQTIITAAISSVFGLGMWWLQKKVENRRTVATELRVAAATELADNAKRERDRLEEEQRELLVRVGILERGMVAADTALTLLKQRATPLLEAAESRMIDMLTHPHPEFTDTDKLLAQVKVDHIITPELAKLLKERETSDHPDVTNGEKLAAAALPGLSELVLVEKEAMEKLALVTQVVSSPAPTEKEEGK